jgi:hypothetical protein
LSARLSGSQFFSNIGANYCVGLHLVRSVLGLFGPATQARIFSFLHFSFLFLQKYMARKKIAKLYIWCRGGRR